MEGCCDVDRVEVALEVGVVWIWAMLGCKLVHGTANDDGDYKNGK